MHQAICDLLEAAIIAIALAGVAAVAYAFAYLPPA